MREGEGLEGGRGADKELKRRSRQRAGRHKQADRQRLHGGTDGGSIHGGDDGRSGQMLPTQSTVKTTAHGGIDGGRSQGGGMADGDRAYLRGSQGDDREPMERASLLALEAWVERQRRASEVEPKIPRHDAEPV
ncbi:hypothetical protein DPX16_20031 [Anabarilius grahami]|uniref:Uncharacterized protein n=1 Tax=Anabarilius grahami TaxID=495550 RepID=A0A3N0XQH1_ANAGA|nr:hypothetical protein DPX16_20031 [Anabarilius grahami]